MKTASPADDPIRTMAAGGHPEARKEIDAVKVKGDLSALREASKIYPAMHDDAFATDIGQLDVPGLVYPGRYLYDPATGRVSDPDHPEW